MITRPARTGLKAAMATAGAVVLLSSGVAFASSGHAPWAHASAAAEASTHAAAPTHPTHPAHPTHPTGGPTDEPSQGTGPNAHAFGGLCRAIISGNKAEHGKALGSPAFGALAAAAGGADSVPAFCDAVTSAAPAPHPTHPTHPAHPTQAATPMHPAHPTQAASPTHPAHPTQAATPTHPTHPAHPTQAATPTQKPTDKPSHPAH